MGIFSRFFEKKPNVSIDFVSKAEQRRALRKRRFYKFWKSFLKQVPREFRSIFKAHPHFIVFGKDQSGKTRLIQSLVDQGNDIYPFELSYAAEKEIQFYVGPRQIIHEVSFDVCEQRGVKQRRQLTFLWKKLFKFRAPTVIIALNPWAESFGNPLEQNREARLIAGKITLLSEICKKPIKTRIVLTHCDKIEGFTGLTHYLSKRNLRIQLDLQPQFEPETLQRQLQEFYKVNLSTMLKASTARDFIQEQTFLKEITHRLGDVEVYLRLLSSRDAGQTPIQLESLFYSSQYALSTSSKAFDFDDKVTISIFFNNPMLKHKLAAACVACIGIGLITNNFIVDTLETQRAEKDIDFLDLVRPQLSSRDALKEIKSIGPGFENFFYLNFLPRFGAKRHKSAQTGLAKFIRQQILEPKLRQLLVEDNSEIKSTFLISLIYATPTGRLGHIISKNLNAWSEELDLSPNLMTAYIEARREDCEAIHRFDYFSRVQTSSAITNLKLWADFFSLLNEALVTQSNSPHLLRKIYNRAQHLSKQLDRIKDRQLLFSVCSALKNHDLGGLEDLKNQIICIQWLDENQEAVTDLLATILANDLHIDNLVALDLSTLISRLDQVSSEVQSFDSKSYRLAFPGKVLKIDAKKWIDLVASFRCESLIDDFISTNQSTQGDIFFSTEREIPPVLLCATSRFFPTFSTAPLLPGRFTKDAFEKIALRSVEKALKQLDAIPISTGSKVRFKNFISQEFLGYAKRYLDAYSQYFEDCHATNKTTYQTKVALESLISPNSTFQHFLSEVFTHTDVLNKETSLNFGNLPKSAFGFLGNMLSAGEDGARPYNDYLEVMRELYRDLNQPTEELTLCDVHFSPIAKISLDIITSAPSSYVSRVTKILIDAGVEESFHGPFLSPVYAVNAIGKVELKKALEKTWTGFFWPKLTTLFNMFPFNMSSPNSSTIEELEAVLNPQKEFWANLHKTIGAVSRVYANSWEPLDSSLEIDPSIYASINRLSELSNLFWDHEGNKKPLEFQVRAVPLSESPDSPLKTISSHLVVGKQIFQNFNLDPAWCKFKVNWWDPSRSAVVIQMQDAGGSRKMRTLQIEESTWGFFRLLAKAQRESGSRWTWKLSGSKNHADAKQFSLDFLSNPWKQIEFNELGQDSLVCKHSSE